MSTDIRLHHVSLIVDDWQRSLAFYRDVLGLTVDDSRPDLAFAGVWLKLIAPGLIDWITRKAYE